MARPSEYNYNLCVDICKEVALGKNVIAVLKSEAKYPSWETFRRWKSEHEELQVLYVNAIQDKSEAMLLEIDEIAKELRAKVIEPSTANVLIQTLKWKAAKFYPKMYGDRTAVDLDANVKVKGIDALSDKEIDKELERFNKKGKS